MERVILKLRQSWADTRPWVAIAVILAAGLSLFFATQGVRYLQAVGNNSSVRDEIGRLERATGPQFDGNAVREARLGATNLRLENLHRLFDYPSADTLMSIVSEVAVYVGLDLISMTADDVKVESRGALQYRVRPISVIIDGPTVSIQAFLAVLYNRVPVVVASNARMVNLDTAPSTQIQLRFFVSPEPLPQEEEENAG